MKDNFYFLCIDEIYSPNLNQLLKLTKSEIFSHPNHWHFGLSGVILAAKSLANLNIKLHGIQKKYYPNLQTLILHYNDILNNKEAFSDLAINKEKRIRFTNSVCSLINNTEFAYIASFLDKHELVKKHGLFNKTGLITHVEKIRGNMYPKASIVDYNLYLLSLKFLIKEFYTFLKNPRLNAKGIIIAEGIGQKEDLELRDAFYKLQCNGVSGIGITDLRETIVDLLIIFKKQNHAGTQLANLLLYPTYDAVIKNHNVRKDHVIDYEKLIKGKLYNSQSIIVYP